MKKAAVLLSAFVLLCIFSPAFAQDKEEEITLSTYYPAPYGEYELLELMRTGLDTGELRLTAPDSTGTRVTVWNLHNRGAGTGVGAITGGDGNKLYLTYFDGTNWAGPHMIVTPLGNVGIGTNAPDPLAILDISSTTRGLLAPRMNTTQRNVMSTAPNIAPEGVIVYDNEAKKWMGYDGKLWLEMVGPVVKVKTADESRNNNTLNNDATLQFPVNAGETWQFEIVLLCYVPFAADIKVSLNGPALGGTGWVNAMVGAVGSVSSGSGGEPGFGRLDTLADTWFSSFTENTDVRIVISGVIANIDPGSVAGTFAVQWAQDTSIAGNPVTVQKGSYLKAWKVS